MLAGFLAGLLAQPALPPDPLKAIRYAVWQHGASADALSAQRTNWTIEDLVAHLGVAGTGGQVGQYGNASGKISTASFGRASEL